MNWSRWHTNGEAQERLSTWQDVLRREMVEVQLRLPNPSGFRCVLNQMQLGDTKFIRFSSTPHAVKRDRVSGDAVSGEGHFMVSAQLNGSTRVQSGDLSIEVRPGDIALLDTARPFVNEFVGDTTRAVVLIGKKRFASATNAIPLGQIPHSNPYFGILRQHILSLTNPAVEHSPEVADALVQSLAVLLGDLPDPAVDQSTAAPKRVAKEEIDAYLYSNVLNTEITTLTIAAEFGVSLRTIFAIYEHANKSLEQAIIEARLKRASEMLISSEFLHLTVTDISAMVGFKDTSHFSRRFRAAYGKPPNAWRATRS